MKKIWIRSKGAEALPLEKALSLALKKEGFELAQGPDTKIDLCISVGGDGTFLAALRELGERRFQVPILGIHASRGRGFLLPVTLPRDEKEWPKFAAKVAKALKSDKHSFENRWGLSATVLSSTGKVLHQRQWALNDIVVSKSTLSRLVWLKVYVDDLEILPRLRGDGFIVSSAAGSTAYSLSAGGSILHPALKNLIITPVCPQTLAHRSVVLGENVKVRVEVLENDTPSYLTSDGQAGLELSSGQSVEIRRSGKPVRFLVPHELAPRYEQYFQILRDKLGFGGE